MVLLIVHERPSKHIIEKGAVVISSVQLSASDMVNINLIVLIALTFHCTGSSQIVERLDIENEVKRFEPNWESLDARVLPAW